MICKKKLLDLYNKSSIPELVEVACVAVGAREQPPPSTVGRSSIYVIIRSDNKLYVGQVNCRSYFSALFSISDVTLWGP